MRVGVVVSSDLGRTLYLTLFGLIQSIFQPSMSASYVFSFVLSRKDEKSTSEGALELDVGVNSNLSFTSR